MSLRGMFKRFMPQSRLYMPLTQNCSRKEVQRLMHTARAGWEPVRSRMHQLLHFLSTCTKSYRDVCNCCVNFVNTPRKSEM